MAEPSPTQRLAGIILGEPVNDWITARRAEGMSWRLISRSLRERTGGQIDVTYETLRAWVGQDAA